MSEPAEQVMSAAAKVNREARANPKLAPTRIRPVEEIARRWRCVLPSGVEPKQVVSDVFFSHVGHQLTVGDIIEVVSEDSRLFMELLVRSCGRNFAKVGVLRAVAFDQAVQPPNELDPYKIDFAGPIDKHRVLRDGQVLKSGFDTKAQAVQWARNHQKAMNR